MPADGAARARPCGSRRGRSGGRRADLAALDADPAVVTEQRADQDAIAVAIAALPERERTATVLFYLGGYAQQEIAAFLGIPVTTIKKRLQAARKQLQERILAMIADSLHQQGPAVDGRFAETVQFFAAFERRRCPASKPSSSSSYSMALTFTHGIAMAGPFWVLRPSVGAWTLSSFSCSGEPTLLPATGAARRPYSGRSPADIARSPDSCANPARAPERGSMRRQADVRGPSSA